MPVGELAENFSRELGAPTKGAEGATHFLAPGKRGWPLRLPIHCSPAIRHYHPLSAAKIDVTDKIERVFILIRRS